MQAVDNQPGRAGRRKTAPVARSREKARPPCGEPGFRLFQNGSGVVMLAVVLNLAGGTTCDPKPYHGDESSYDTQDKYVHITQARGNCPASLISCGGLRIRRRPARPLPRGPKPPRIHLSCNFLSIGGERKNPGIADARGFDSFLPLDRMVSVWMFFKGLGIPRCHPDATGYDQPSNKT